MIHAMTDCDALSSFLGHGEKNAWAVFPEFKHALLEFVFCLKWQTTGGKDHNKQVHYTALWTKHQQRHRRNRVEDICKEAQCAVKPPHKGYLGGTCKESSEATFGVKCWCSHNYHCHVNGLCKDKPAGHAGWMQTSSAMNVCPVKVRRAIVYQSTHLFYHLSHNKTLWFGRHVAYYFLKQRSQAISTFHIPENLLG